MAEIDRREAILERLLAILKTIAGPEKGFRNRIDIPENRRPALVMLDADEVRDDTDDGKGRPPNAPMWIHMTPELYILLGAKSENIGADLNLFRIQLIKAILSDQTLIGLVKDGDIRFLGYTTGLASGRSMEGEAGISFQFRYMVHPSKL